MSTADPGGPDKVEAAFKQFFTADSCESIRQSFTQLLQATGLQGQTGDQRAVYNGLRNKLQGYYKAQELLKLLDKKAAHPVYKQGKVCTSTKVLVVGAGPCGLRIAIECALLGAPTVVVEKRGTFSRNNVLHLWPYLITDLRSLGAKLFFPRFCAGSLDHISIRRLQCVLLKVVLLLGVDVHFDVAVDGLKEPSKEKTDGWKIHCTPSTHSLEQFRFDIIIGASGKQGALQEFKRKELRGKLAIAITANFINHNTKEDAQVEEISGVAAIYNQELFAKLKEKTGVDLENIVYYKDDTHYFVMTAKKQSLLQKGVLKQNHADVVALLKSDNVNQDALMDYAKEAAKFTTEYKLQFQEFAKDHRGKPDIAVFDFTSMFAAANACCVKERNGHRLLMGLVGDSLLEPFWPMGTGCARGFLGVFDAAWMILNWSKGEMTPLQIIVERESIYSILSQTTPERVIKDYEKYSIDPKTRYPNLNKCCLKKAQVAHLYDGIIDPKELEDEAEVQQLSSSRKTSASSTDRHNLLLWCQQVLNNGNYSGVNITNFTTSWHSGLGFCALIHAFHPRLIKNMQSLPGQRSVAEVNQLAFDVARRELGVTPLMTGKEMASCKEPDELTVRAYLSQFYELFKDKPLTSANLKNKQTKILLDRPERLIPEKLDSLPRNVKNRTLDRKKDQLQIDKKQKEASTSMLPRNTAKSSARQVEDASEEPLSSKETGQGAKKRGFFSRLSKKNQAKKKKAKGRAKQQKNEQGNQAENMGDKQRGHSDRTPSDVKAKIEMFGGRKTSNGQQANLQQESDLEPEPSFFCGLLSCHKKSKKEEKRDKELEENVSENMQLAKSSQLAVSQTVTGQSHDAQAGGKVKAMKEKLEKIQSEAEEGVHRKERKGIKAPGENVQKSPATRTPQKQPQAQGQAVPASELCYFCHKRVYLMERLTAEGLFFHHKCFKCSFCQVELRIMNYESEKLRNGIVNFYCARHAVPEKRIATGISRKRPLDRTNTRDENVDEEVKTSEKGEQHSEGAQHKKTTTKPEETKHAPTISLSPAGDDKNKDSTDGTQKKDKKKKEKESKSKNGKENNTTKSLEEFDGVEVANREKSETDLPSLRQLRQTLEKLLSKAPKIKTSGADIMDWASFLLDEDEKPESGKDQALKKQEKMVTLQRKRAEQQRLFAAQEIQRRLQEIDLHMQELEQQGKQLEKEIRDKGTDYDIKDQAMGKWMNLIKEKNILMRHEAKLVLRAKELELEDTQTRMQLKLNETSKKQDKDKTPKELEEERQIINDLTNVVKQRIALATKLEDDKHREEDEDQSVEAMMKEKGFLLVPLPYSHQLKLGSVENLASP